MDVIASRDHYAAHLAPVSRLVEDVEGVLVASYGDLLTATQRGHERIVLMQHGAGQSYSDRHPHYPGGDDNEAVSLFLTPGPHPAMRWRERYPDTPVVEVGSPRLDTLPHREAGPPTVAVTFHWDAYHHPEARSAFSWYRSALPKLRDAFRLIGHGHPRAKHLPRDYERLDIEWVPTFEEVCRRADVLLADNTSALFEFAATGRPVVVLNAPWYRHSVHHGIRFWDAADVGSQVGHPDDVMAAVRFAMSYPEVESRRRELALAKVYSYRTDAAQRAADAIREYMT